MPFAKDPERILPTTERVKNEFNKNKWQKEISYVIATEELFIEQIRHADAIYIQGGTTKKLLTSFEQFRQHDFKKLFEGKTIAGESAGANILSKFCYSKNANEVIEGLGILPIKIIPHYSLEYKGKLDSVGEKLEEVLLPEYKLKVFEI